MSQNRIIIGLFFLIVSAFANAGVMDSLEYVAGKQKDSVRMSTLGLMYQISQSTEDMDMQYMRLTRWVNECLKNNFHEKTSEALLDRISFFYNNDLNDSVYKYRDEDLAFLRNNGLWRFYYGYWCLVVNTYVYDGKVTLGLQEAEKLYADAKERGNDFGMGLGYYALGNAYYLLNDMEETTSAYKKSIELLLHQKPLPVQLTEIFSSQCEALERIGDYAQMDKNNLQWREYISLLTQEYGLEEFHIGLFPIWAYYYIGCAQADMGQGRFDQLQGKTLLTCFQGFTGRSKRLMMSFESFHGVFGF